MNKNIKEKRIEETQKFILKFLEKLPHTKEDKEKIDKILRFYARKRKVQSGTPKNLAAAIIWLYGRINFMHESEGKAWTQNSVAKICGVNVSTISAKAGLLMKELKIDMFDQRFARNEMVEKNPMMKMMVDPLTGMLFLDDGGIDALGGLPMIRRKDDYYYDAMEYMNMGDMDGAIRLCKKAVDIDEHYVAGYLGLAWAYNYKGNMKKYEEYANRAFEETRKVFPVWPKVMLWGVLENRQYMRAIHEKANVFWENGERKEAEKLFRLLLEMNPGDNQGIRFLLAGMFAGITGEDVDNLTDEGNQKQDWSKIDNLLLEQNAKHKFWEAPKYDENGE